GSTTDRAPCPLLRAREPINQATLVHSSESLGSRHRCRGERGMSRNGEGLTSFRRSDRVISCDVGSGCASGASCAPLYDALCLVDDWPYFLLWRHRDTPSPRGTKPEFCGSRTKVQILSGNRLVAQGLGTMRFDLTGQTVIWYASSSLSPKRG